MMQWQLLQNAKQPSFEIASKLYKQKQNQPSKILKTHRRSRIQSQTSKTFKQATYYKTDSNFEEMDSRIYFHQYCRPRYSNPTYSSNNMSNSIPIFNPKQATIRDSYPIEDQGFKYHHQRNQANSLQSKQMKETFNSRNDDLKTISTSNDIPEAKNSRGSSHNRNISNLSSYGSNSLQLSEREIYNKNNSKYNIISMKPIEHDTSIKQYPKYSLENKDEVFYKRMAEELQKKKQNFDHYEKIHQQKEAFIAGKHTYGHDRKREQVEGEETNPEEEPSDYDKYITGKKKGFTAKMLNHMDELQHLS